MKKIIISVALLAGLLTVGCSKEKDQPAPQPSPQSTVTLKPIGVHYDLYVDTRSVVNFNSNGVKTYELYSQPGNNWDRYEISYTLDAGEHFTVDVTLDSTGLGGNYNSPGLIVSVAGIIDTILPVPGAVEFHYNVVNN